MECIANLVETYQVEKDWDSAYELWHKLMPMIRKWAYRTQLNHYDGTDLVQESYLQLINCLNNYDKTYGVPFELYYRKHLYGWRANKLRKKQDILSTEDTFQIEEHLADSTDIAFEVEIKLMFESVCELMKILSSQERAIIWEYYIEGKSLKEMAEMRGLSYKALEGRKNRIIRKLRQLLK